MTIFLHEVKTEVDVGITAFALRRARKPDADIVIVNGAIISSDVTLVHGDHVHLIRRGEIPSAEEMESLLVSRHTPGVHQAVRSGVVGIGGIGGLGSTIAVALARTGVGRLILADFDVVEPSNLNRQQYAVDHIGMYKADAIREVLRRINPYVAVETHVVRLDADNLDDVFGDVDVMVEAFDSPQAKTMIIGAWRRLRPDTPLVTASGLAGYGSANRIRTRKILRNLYLVGDEETAAGPGVGLMAPRVGVAASHQANAVLQLLLGCDPSE